MCAHQNRSQVMLLYASDNNKLQTVLVWVCVSDGGFQMYWRWILATSETVDSRLALSCSCLLSSPSLILPSYLRTPFTLPFTLLVSWFATPDSSTYLYPSTTPICSICIASFQASVVAQLVHFRWPTMSEQEMADSKDLQRLKNKRRARKGLITTKIANLQRLLDEGGKRTGISYLHGKLVEVFDEASVIAFHQLLLLTTTSDLVYRSNPFRSFFLRHSSHHSVEEFICSRSSDHHSVEEFMFQGWSSS